MSIMVTTKKDSIEFNKYLEELKNNPGKKGPNDLEQKIEDLTKELVVEKQLSNILKNKVTSNHERMKDMEKIESVHRKLNGELRKEVYEWKIKAAKADEYKTTIEQQRMVISDLTLDNQRLAREVDDKTNKLRKAGLI